MNKNLKNISIIIVLGWLICLFAGPGAAFAQMFSVKSLPHRETPPSTVAYFALVPSRFHYKPSGAGTNTAPGILNFNAPLYRLGIGFSGLEVTGTAGWNLGEDNSLNYYDLDFAFDMPYPVLRTRSFTLSLPLAFGIELTRVENTRSDINNFRENTLEAGTGLQAAFRFPRQIRLMLEGTAHYGFSTRAFGQSSGSAWIIENKNRLYFDHVFGQVGIVLGFDYRFTRFNGSGVQFDYGLRNLAFVIGADF